MLVNKHVLTHYCIKLKDKEKFADHSCSIPFSGDTTILLKCNHDCVIIIILTLKILRKKNHIE